MFVSAAGFYQPEKGRKNQWAHHLHGGAEYNMFTVKITIRLGLITMITYTDETVLLMAPSYLFHRYGDNNSPRRVMNGHIQHTHKMLCLKGSAKAFAARRNKKQLNVQETLGRGLQC